LLTCIPYLVWWVRNSATILHDFLDDAAVLSVIPSFIDDILDSGKIAADFNIGQLSKPADLGLIGDIFKVIAPFFSMGDKVIKHLPGLGLEADIVGFAGGFLSQIAADFSLSAATGDSGNPPTVQELIDSISSQLKNEFNGALNAIQTFRKQMMVGLTDPNEKDVLGNYIDQMQKAGANVPDDSHHPIARIFGTGAWVSKQNGFYEGLQQGMKDGLSQVRQQMVTTVLAAQNVVAHKNTEGKQDICNKITGSRWIDNACVTLAQLKLTKPDGTDVVLEDATDLPADIMLKFDDPNAGYNIDVEAMYRNIIACNNAKPTYTDTPATFDGDVPPCFWGIPVAVSGNQICPAADSMPDSIKWKFCSGSQGGKSGSTTQVGFGGHGP